MSNEPCSKCGRICGFEADDPYVGGEVICPDCMEKTSESQAPISTREEERHQEIVNLLEKITSALNDVCNLLESISDHTR